MSYEVVIGIDPSLTGMATCVWHFGRVTHEQIARITSKPLGDGAALRCKRYRDLLNEMFDRCTWFNHSPKPLVLLEGYSYGSPAKAQYLGELGGILRNTLCGTLGLEVIEVAPQSLKKFVCGKGGAKKEQVIAHVHARWGQLFDTNDEADAYGLAQMARCYAGWVEPANAAQRDVIEQLKNPAVKVRKKKVPSDE